MGFNVTHAGLYFGQDEISNARSQREKDENLQTAWQWLLATSGDVIKERKPETQDAQPEQVVKADLSDAGKLIEAAFRARFADDDSALTIAETILSGGFGLNERDTLFDTITDTLSSAHAFEILRDRLSDNQAWLKTFADFTEHLLQQETADFIEQLWLITLRVVSAVVLEDKTRFDEGIQAVKQIIDTQIHPEGYFKPLADNPATKETAYKDMVLACAALSLASEAATQAGETLWKHEARDVSLNTAITYLVYYYFYPGKWRWGEGELTEAHTQAIFADYGAWIEISTRRINSRGVELLLDDQRPFFGSYTGGLTTLTHIIKAKRWRFGLF